MYKDTVAGKFPCRETLEARVFDFDQEAAIHGYSISNDLLHHYSFTDILYLTVTEELPTKAQRICFDLALSLLLPAPVTRDTVHAGILTRVYNAHAADLLSSIAPICAERGHHTVSNHLPFLEWLSHQAGTPPDTAIGKAALSCELTSILAKSDLTLQALEHPLTDTAAVIVLLYEAGISSTEHIEFLVCWISFIAPSAEGMARAPFQLRNYPMRLPRFVDSGHE